MYNFEEEEEGASRSGSPNFASADTRKLLNIVNQRDPICYYGLWAAAAEFNDHEVDTKHLKSGLE